MGVSGILRICFLLLVFFFVSNEAGVKVVGLYGRWNCKGYEDNTSAGAGTRPFRVLCTEMGIKPQNLECRFTGNPHNCRAYNKNAKPFFQQLLDKIGNHMSKTNACGPTTISDTRHCGSQAIYTMESFVPRATSPQPEVRRTSRQSNVGRTSRLSKSKWTSPQPKVKWTNPQPKVKWTNPQPKVKWTNPQLEVRKGSPKPKVKKGGKKRVFGG